MKESGGTIARAMQLPGDIEVECYAGQRAAVSPRWVHISGKRLGVARIWSEQICSSFSGTLLERRFDVELEDGSRIILSFDEAKGRWFQD